VLAVEAKAKAKKIQVMREEICKMLNGIIENDKMGNAKEDEE